MPMEIRFSEKEDKDCKDIIVDIWPVGTDGPGMRLKWSCGTTIERVAMLRFLRESFYESVERLAKKSYEHGYKDGRAKRKKQGWFASNLACPDRLL